DLALIGRDQLGRCGLAVEVPGLRLLHPDPEQARVNPAPPGNPVQRLATEIFGDDRLLEVNAERATVSRHGLSSSESPSRSIPNLKLSKPRGAVHSAGSLTLLSFDISCLTSVPLRDRSPLPENLIEGSPHGHIKVGHR